MYAVVFFVLVLTAAGFAAAYYSLRSEASQLRGQQGILLGRSKLLEGVVDEVSASWVGMSQLEDEEPLALARAVAQCLPNLLNSSAAQSRQIGLPRHKFTQADFGAAALSNEHSKITDLLASIDDPTLTQLWDSRRILDLMSMLRLVQSRLNKGSSQTKPTTVAPGSGNPLIYMLREEADAADICAELAKQVEMPSSGSQSNESDPQASLALQAIIEALSFRRNALDKPFTLAVLVLALSGRGLENLYRECRHDAETVHGSWRAQFTALKAYVESLPGWDGRLPFADMMIATHDSHVARALAVLMRVS